MQADCTHISYQLTGYFSKIVSDYLEERPTIQPFYQHSVSIEGIKAAIEARQQFPRQKELRNLLVTELGKQYAGLLLEEKLSQNIALLADDNTFTVTTAHQPNIFTGPIYFIYKILHAVQLANQLAEQLPQYKFVPVYYMGSEDADLDELGGITINGQAYRWQTKQTGAVGRMKVDKNFIALMMQIHGQVGVEQYGEELITLFKQCYREGITIQQATLEMVNALFGRYGLVVIIPDNRDLKHAFNSVVKKELTEGFSHKAVASTLSELEKSYKAQAGGREINLFYLTGDKRERIEKEGDKWVVKSLQVEWTETEVLDKVDKEPESFSANVILRGAFQETILPNIAFIGGGGELAYWLELKKVFGEVNIPYPVLILRNSFLLVEERLQKKIQSTGFTYEEVFKPEQALLDMIVAKKSSNQFHLNGELSKVETAYADIKELAGKIDGSLLDHVEALKRNQ